MSVMRKEYRQLTDEEKAEMNTIKQMGEEFVALCDRLQPGREMSLAKTKMEEAVMWAVKGITG